MGAASLDSLSPCLRRQVDSTFLSQASCFYDGCADVGAFILSVTARRRTCLLVLISNFFSLVCNGMVQIMHTPSANGKSKLSSYDYSVIIHPIHNS